MKVLLYAHTCVCIYIYIWGHIHIHIYIYIHISTPTCVCVCVRSIYTYILVSLIRTVYLDQKHGNYLPFQALFKVSGTAS